MSGEMRPTATYWTTYIYFINVVHRNLMKAVRMNDLKLYVEVLPLVLDLITVSLLHFADNLISKLASSNFL